jgi:hypothetical protein
MDIPAPKTGDFEMGPKHKMASFSKTTLNDLIAFHLFMERMSLNKTAQV